MWNLGIDFSGGLGSVGVTAGHSDHRGLFQQKQLYNSMNYLQSSNEIEITAYSYLQRKS